MHSFLFIGGIEPQLAAQQALAAQTALKGEYPETGADLILRALDLGDFPGALVTLGPRDDFTPALFDQASDDSFTLFCFGKVASAQATGQQSMATRLLSVVRRSGVAAARQLDGSFAAVLIDRSAREVQAFTDLVGMRSLRCANWRDGVAIASHDLALVALGAAAGKFDMDSLAATVACDWSLGGHPLLESIRVSGGPCRTTWRAKGLEHHFEPLVSVAGRHNTTAPEALEAVASAMERGARAFAKGRDRIRFSLTAGKDSRLLLALLSAFSDGHLRAQTNGNEASQDVVVAKKLARLVGIEHQTASVSPPSLDSFAGMTNLLSLSMNGMTNAKRALAPLPRWDSNRDVLAGGEGGEIFAGFFYRSARGLNPARVDPEVLAQRLINHRFKRLGSLRFSDPACAGRLRERLVASLTALSSVSQSPHDLLDLFYLYERYAIWGSFGERSTWARRWTPFSNTEAIRLAYSLPTPIGQHCTVHELLIRRHLPTRALLTPINGSELLLLSGPGRARSLLRRLLKEVGKRAVSRSAESRSTAPLTSRAHIFATDLLDYIQDTLLSNGSIALSLLNADAAAALIEQHRRNLSQIQPIGFLLTAEAFRQQVQRLEAHSLRAGGSHSR